MSEISITIVSDNVAGLQDEMRSLLPPPLGGATVKAYQTLLEDNAKLVREAGTINADAISAAYNDGARDARTEMQQELAMNRNDKLFAMLEHDEVMVCMAPGYAPFRFAPSYAATFNSVPFITAGHGLPQYQRELIGTDPKTVGIYGINRVTDRPIFLTQIDHWTLAPDAPTE